MEAGPFGGLRFAEDQSVDGVEVLGAEVEVVAVAVAYAPLELALSTTVGAGLAFDPAEDGHEAGGELRGEDVGGGGHSEFLVHGAGLGEAFHDLADDAEFAGGEGGHAGSWWGGRKGRVMTGRRCFLSAAGYAWAPYRGGLTWQATAVRYGGRGFTCRALLPGRRRLRERGRPRARGALAGLGYDGTPESAGCEPGFRAFGQTGSTCD
ncbi:hypothetical protein D3C59_37110 [Streptomyces sp. SHP22-7]|nr:hypothetical protein D3C59_37110 [Streptomyces sp. SHP22-7]